MNKVLVIGVSGQEAHETDVRNYYLAIDAAATVHIAMVGAGTPSGSIVAYLANVAACVDYAIQNDYITIVRSYTGVYTYKPEWDEAIAAGIMVYHAHGSNSHVLLEEPPRMFGAICVGGGKAGVNERSYGKMEAFDKTAAEATEESWATPTYAARGGLLREADNALTLWDVRAKQRMGCSYYLTGWVPDGGYGEAGPAPETAIALQPPLEVYAVKSGDNTTVTLYWENFAQSRWSKTRIVKQSDGKTIYTGTGEQHTYYSDVEGNETFLFYSEDAEGNLSAAVSYAQVTVTGLKIYYFPVPFPTEEAMQYIYRSSLGVRKFV